MIFVHISFQKRFSLRIKNSSVTKWFISSFNRPQWGFGEIWSPYEFFSSDWKVSKYTQIISAMLPVSTCIKEDP